MKSFVMALSLAMVLMVGSNALAQGYVAYMPVGPAPVAAYYAPAPLVSYGPVVSTSYYAPIPYYVASPVVTPYYVASPVAVGAVAVGPIYGRPVIVRPKIYVPGQPVRNVLRAVTP
ncbi:MAG: hypothetical protein ACLP9L_05190 [Thermoguttaceae bacterium]